jgi:two-component sensor histidine kinase
LTLRLGQDAAALLAALSEPALVIGQAGQLLDHNRAAAQVFGTRMEVRPVGDWVADDSEGFASYLRRCLGSSPPLLGALTVRTAGGPQRFQARGARIDLSGGAAVLLRLTRSDEVQFHALTRKVDELNVEITQRKRAEAILHETLSEREVLLRELQHRVKNNMQMLAGMLFGAAREASTESARLALADVAGRFSAVSAVQQLLYAGDTGESVGSEDLVSTLVSAAAALDEQVELTSRVDAVALPTEKAVPVALILNELLTNALKYGRPVTGAQRITTDFAVSDKTVRLEIRDNGPGFDLGQVTHRASGLGLVKALLRQLGGSLSVTKGEGGHCVATFSVAEALLRRNGA